MSQRLLKDCVDHAPGKIHAIWEVMTRNADLMMHFEFKGVTARDLDILCDMAIREAERTDK